jgi:hypothetical protein
VFTLVKDYFLKRHLMLGVCETIRTDGAPAILVKKFRNCLHVCQEILRIMVTVSMLHNHASTAKTLFTLLEEILSITNSVVIFIRVRALNHCSFCALCEEISAERIILIFLIEW